MTPVRINARLSNEDATKLDYLVKNMGISLTETIKKAIGVLYQQWHRQKSDAENILKKTKFIACSKGSRTLSETYKKDLSSGWSGKHDHR